MRALGLSNHSVDQLTRAEAVAHVDAIQPHFSMVTRDVAPELAWAEAHGTGAIVYSPMQSGLLTGAFTAERVAALPEDDWRKAAPDFTTGLPANLDLVEALRPVAARHGVPVAAVAVAWTLAWPGRHRGHRRRPQPRPDRRLAARRRPHADGRGPGRDQGGGRGYGRRVGAARALIPPRWGRQITGSPRRFVPWTRRRRDCPVGPGDAAIGVGVGPRPSW